MKTKKELSKNYKKLELIQSPHLNKDWLSLKYITEGLSTYEIAKIVNRNPKNIYCKLKDFGIPTRTRAETLQKNSWWKLGLPSKRVGKKHSEKTKIKISKTRIERKIKGLSGEDNHMYGRTGEKSPNWKGGVTPERQRLYATKEWNSINSKVFERDNWVCQRCGGKHSYRNQLHAHHIKSWADYPDNRLELSNLITICKKCHHWIHSKKNTKKDFLG
jgi:thymidylate synthase (FAD)